MAGHQHTLSAALVASVVLVAACSFDTSVEFEGTAGNGDNTGGLPSDAAPIPDAGRSLFPDADDIESNPDAAVDAAVSVPDGTLQSIRSMQTITLDGELDAEWQALDFVEFALVDAELLEVVPTYVANGSVRIASMYDAEHIYFFLEVHDDIIVDDSVDTYNDDSVELSIDGLNDRSGPLGNDDHWLVVGAEGVYASLGPAEVDITGSILVTDVGYNIEIAFERSELGAGTSSLLGFNLAINDDDGVGSSGVDAYALWHLPSTADCTNCCDGFSANYPWCDTTRLGQLELVP